MSTLRLFTAVELPSAMRHAVHAAAGALLRPPAGARCGASRIVPAANLHVTLRFLGATSEERVPAIVSALRRAVAPLAPGEIRMSRFDLFPSRRRPRGMWCEVDDTSGVLARLERALTEALRPLGLPPENRPFRQHVTVARFGARSGGARSGSLTRAVVERLAAAGTAHAVAPESMLVEYVTLFRSSARAAEQHAGPRYDALARVPLGASDEYPSNGHASNGATHPSQVPAAMGEVSRTMGPTGTA